MVGSAQKIRDYTGPAFYSHGFRSFFMFAGIWGAMAMSVWVVLLAMGIPIPSRMAGVDWHMHEMVFGYAPAVIAGFLLTAVPNWTGRLPILGWPNALLSGLWVLGRVAIFYSAYLPLWAAPIIDVSFLIIFAWVIGTEIIAAKNWRNLKVLVILIALAATNILFHFEAIYGFAYEGYSIRLGVGIIVLLITIIGGRVIPSFTRNWLVKQGKSRLPQPRGRVDDGVEFATGLLLIIWVVVPEGAGAGVGWALLALFHLYRLWRWVGWQTFAEPMVAILHAGYLFIPLGFFMLAARNLFPDLGLPLIPHAWMVGAIGVMTLAMMSRASLGHSGRPIQSNWVVNTIFALIIGAALLRMTVDFMPGNLGLLHSSALAWIAGFSVFILGYFPIFTKPRH